MSGLLLIAHAPLASALQAVARHTFPDCARQLEALDVAPEMSADQVLAAARPLLERLGPDVLILTDVFGATPCNAALRLVDDVHVRLLAGLNVPMLWRSLCYSNEPLDQLIERARSGGIKGVVPVAAPDRSAADPSAT
jgi:PTS system mannose-specific IIA component